MPKKSSRTETEQVATVAATAPAPASTKKQSKSKAAKVEEPVVVPQPVAEPEPKVVQGPAETPYEGDAGLADQSTDFLTKLQQLSVSISNLKSEYRALEKRWSREMKIAQKVSSKRKRKTGNRAPSGFVKPTKISDELAAFLGKEKGSEMARTDVTREINTYIRSNSLQAKDNGRKIIPDAKLTALLKLKKEDELTYFNLQKYMSPHFAKASK